MRSTKKNLSACMTVLYVIAGIMVSLILGIDDPDVGIYAGLISLGVLIMHLIDIAIAGMFGEIAEDKGYDGSRSFMLCYWCGFVGFLYVCALPDKSLNNTSNKFNSVNQQNKVSTKTETYNDSRSTPKFNDLPKI